MATTGSRDRRPLALLLVAAAAVGLLGCRPSAVRPTCPDADVVLLASWGAWLVGAYLVGAVAVTLGTQLASGTAIQVAPRRLQAAIERGLGLAVAGTVLAQPAVALAQAPHPRPVAPGDPVRPQLSADWPALQPTRASAAGAERTTRLAHHRHARRPVLAPRPTDAAPPTGVAPRTGVAPPTSRPAPHAARVVVRAGDSLWTIAATRLGRGVPAHRVAAEWPRWWAANRTLIGSDPDLIHPGQRLQPPDPRSIR
jgi:nucleoid-associated protein YgaU